MEKRSQNAQQGRCARALLEKETYFVANIALVKNKDFTQRFLWKSLMFRSNFIYFLASVTHSAN